MEQRPNEQELMEMLAGIVPGQKGMLPPVPAGDVPPEMRTQAQGPDIPEEMRTPEPPPVTPPKRRKPERKKAEDEDELVGRCYELFEEFRSAYVPEWARQERNGKIYRCEHWELMRNGEAEDEGGWIEPVTPLVQSIVENIKADLMDGFPEAVVRSTEPEYNDVADVIGAIIAQNHEEQSFREEYRKMCQDLLLNGWCVSETGYDTHAYSNIGMAFTRRVNIRNILFDPEVENVQDGRAVFKVSRVTIKRLEEMYPEFEGEFEADVYDLMEEQDTQIRKDSTKDLLLIEYWWREYDAEDGRYRVHMAKVAGHKLLEDSRRAKPEGYFSAGVYPFVVTTAHERSGSPLGLGMGDSFGKVQMFSDKMDQIVIKNTIMSSKNKMLVQRSSGFDAEDLQDWEKEVHVGDNLGGVTWMATPQLPAHIINYVQLMRQTARDESGANDFSRGNTASGVTAASAIAALQEASGKRSRMLKDQLHESYKKAVKMEIVFEREYNVLPRNVLVVKNGEEIPMTFESALMTHTANSGVEVPIEFMIDVEVETQRQWQVQTHNELMIQLLQLRVLDPMMLLDNMIFNGRQAIIKQVSDKQKQQAEAAAAQAMAQGGPEASPEEMQQAEEMREAEEAQAQAEQAVKNLPDPKALAQAGGQPAGSIVMRQ